MSIGLSIAPKAHPLTGKPTNHSRVCPPDQPVGYLINAISYHAPRTTNLDHMQHSLDDPLDDEGSLKEQLERLPVICLFQVRIRRCGVVWSGVIAWYVGESFSVSLYLCIPHRSTSDPAVTTQPHHHHLKQYASVAQFLTSYLDPVLRAYEEKVLNNPSPHEHARAAPDAGREMEVCEFELG